VPQNFRISWKQKTHQSEFFVLLRVLDEFRALDWLNIEKELQYYEFTK